MHSDNHAPAALSIREFCERYRLGRSTAYELIGSGAVDAVKIGASMRITAASAESWFSSLPRAEIRTGKRAA